VQYGIDDGEYPVLAPMRESQCENCRSRKARTAAQYAKGVANIVGEVFDEVAYWHAARLSATLPGNVRHFAAKQGPGGQTHDDKISLCRKQQFAA
jgi:hypothetical protein